MGMEPIRGFTGVHGEEAWSLVRARRVVWAWNQSGALLACMEKKHGVLSVRGGWYEHGPDQGLYWRVWRRSMESCPCEEGGMSMGQIRGFTSVYGEEAWSLVRARRVV